jgi:hypothetical protein
MAEQQFSSYAARLAQVRSGGSGVWGEEESMFVCCCRWYIVYRYATLGAEVWLLRVVVLAAVAVACVCVCVCGWVSVCAL